MGTGHALVPLHLQTGVWPSPAAAKDDSDNEKGGGGMAAMLSTRMVLKLLWSSPAMGLAFGSLFHLVSASSTLFSQGDEVDVEPPMASHGSCWPEDVGALGSAGLELLNLLTASVVLSTL